MNAAAFIEHLEHVRSQGPGKWRARCPAHSDTNPSLSVREGDDGRILLHCFSGCQPTEIVAAMGLTMRDLFPDTPVDRDVLRRAWIRRQAERRRRQAAGRRADLYREAETVLNGVTGVSIAELSDGELDMIMNIACDAHQILEGEDPDAEKTLA